MAGVTAQRWPGWRRHSAPQERARPPRMLAAAPVPEVEIERHRALDLDLLGRRPPKGAPSASARHRACSRGCRGAAQSAFFQSPALRAVTPSVRVGNPGRSGFSSCETKKGPVPYPTRPASGRLTRPGKTPSARWNGRAANDARAAPPGAPAAWPPRPARRPGRSLRSRDAGRPARPPACNPFGSGWPATRCA